jgi:hypothetical protein
MHKKPNIKGIGRMNEIALSKNTSNAHGGGSRNFFFGAMRERAINTTQRQAASG